MAPTGAKARAAERLRTALPPAAYDSLRGVYHRARAAVGRNPGRGRMLPDFLIIGAPRCGSTSLHGWLVEHPFVARTPKEIHFFNMHYYAGADWYRRHFPLERERAAFARDHGRGFLAGEATASYLANHWTPSRAAKLVPNARLILCLRDPVDRAHSHFHNFRRRGAEELERFEDAIAMEEERLRGEEEHEIADPHYHSWRVYRYGYLRSSRYAEHLERWFATFPREQFLILKFEEMVAAPETSLARIHDHLGLPAAEPRELPRLNAASYEPLAEETRTQLEDYFAPHNRHLYELTGIDFGWPA